MKLSFSVTLLQVFLVVLPARTIAVAFVDNASLGVESVMRQAFLTVDPVASLIAPIWNGTSMLPLTNETLRRTTAVARVLTENRAKTISSVCTLVVRCGQTYYPPSATTLYYAIGSNPDPCANCLASKWIQGYQVCNAISFFVADPGEPTECYVRTPSETTTSSCKSYTKQDLLTFSSEACSTQSGDVIQRLTNAAPSSDSPFFIMRAEERVGGNGASLFFGSVFDVTFAEKFGVEIELEPSSLASALQEAAGDIADPSQKHHFAITYPSQDFNSFQFIATTFQLETELFSTLLDIIDAAAAELPNNNSELCHGGNGSANAQILAECARKLLENVSKDSATRSTLFGESLLSSSNVTLGNLQLRARKLDFASVHPTFSSTTMQIYIVEFCFSLHGTLTATHHTRSAPSLTATASAHSSPSYFSASRSLSTVSATGQTKTVSAPTATASAARMPQKAGAGSGALVNSLEGLIGSEGAARAIVVSGGGGSIVAAALTSVPAAASFMSRIGSLAKVLECDLTGGVDSCEAEPEATELPLYCGLGRSCLRYVAGGVVLTGGFLVLLPSLCMLVFYKMLVAQGTAPRQATSRAGSDPPSSPLSGLAKLQQNFVSVVTGVCIAYLGPNVVGSSVMLLLHEGSTTSLISGYCGLAAVCVCSVTFAVSMLRLNPMSLAASFRRDSAPTAAEVTLWSFGESAADPERLLSRMYYFVEFTMSSTMCILGVLPPFGGSCSGPAFLMVVAAVAYLLFLLWVRPYKALFDTFFAFVGGVIQLVMAVSAVFITTQDQSTTWMRLFSALVIVQSQLFVVQAAAAAVCSCVRSFRRHDDGELAAALEVPLNPLGAEKA